MGWRRRSGKVWKRDQEISFSKVLHVNLYLWKESKWEDANKKGVRPYNRDERRVYAKEGEDVFIVKKRKERGTQVHLRTTEEEVY